MDFRESETVELKSVVVEDVKKEIIAFANSNGGTLYIGISDHGDPIGVSNTDETIQHIANMVRDSIKPDITMFLHYNTITIAGKQIIAIEIQQGTNKPYYLAKKGLRPEGVYVRQGTSSVPASDAAIRRMIKETDGDSFEAMRSLEQELTFADAEKEFSLRSIPFEKPQKQTLKLIRNDIYTNLAYLLSDQCTHTVKAAVFEGTDQSIFKDRREFSGSLLRQLNDVYSYIDLHNATRATFEGLLRIDTRAYPEVAVREALLNSLVHRDYSYSASTLISIYADRIEFVSIGGLMPGLELDDILMGVSVCRNQRLADVFYRLQLIEAYGTGMRKIFNAYTGKAVQPVVEKTSNAFKIILPSLVAEPVAQETKAVLSNQENAVLAFAAKNGSVTRAEAEKLLGISGSTASRLLRRMVKQGFLVQNGSAKTTKYLLP